MKQVRENVFQVTFEELGSPFEKGWASLPEGGRLLLDEADMRFIAEMRDQGYENPTFFIGRTAALANDYGVLSRQWNNRVQA